MGMTFFTGPLVNILPGVMAGGSASQPLYRGGETAASVRRAEALVLSDRATLQAAEQQVLLDVDVGQHRTGIAPGEEAAALYESIWMSTIVSTSRTEPAAVDVVDVGVAPRVDGALERGQRFAGRCAAPPGTSSA
jgi:hypothetical protein